MRSLIRRWRIPKLYFELGIILCGVFLTGLAIWLFDALPFLVSWLWFIAGMFFGVVILCVVVAFFMLGARGDDTSDKEKLAALRDLKRKPRLVKNGNSDHT